MEKEYLPCLTYACMTLKFATSNATWIHFLSILSFFSSFPFNHFSSHIYVWLPQLKKGEKTEMKWNESKLKILKTLNVIVIWRHFFTTIDSNVVYASVQFISHFIENGKCGLEKWGRDDCVPFIFYGTYEFQSLNVSCFLRKLKCYTYNRGALRGKQRRK